MELFSLKKYSSVRSIAFFLRDGNYTKGLITTLLVIICPTVLFSQNRIHGVVIEREGNIVPGALITLYLLPDSTFVSNTSTDQNGNFSLSIDERYDKKNLFVEVSCVGYTKQFVDVDNLFKPVVLDEYVQNLDEVVVTAERPTFKRKGGKFIYTPNIADKSFNDCYSLLKLAPMLKVENNSVSIIGRGQSTIFINGRRTTMTKDMLMDYLRSLPPGRLERIEINPTSGVAHSATMKNGIVNIILKRQDDGFMGRVGVDIGYLAERITPRLSSNINYAKNKFQIGLNISFLEDNQFARQNFEYLFKKEKKTTKSEYINNSKLDRLNTYLNLSYDLTPNSIIGASASFGLQRGKIETNWNNLYSSPIKNTFTTTTKELSRIPLKHPVYSAKLFYNLKTDKLGSNLDMSVSYSNLKSSTEKVGEQNNGTELSTYMQNIDTDNYGINGLAKYKHLFDDNNKIELGYEINHSYLSNNYVYLKGVDNGYIIDTDVSNHFNYDETINAGFVSYFRQWNEVFNTILGMRLERTDIKGFQKTTGERLSNSYTNFFPQVGLEFDLADGNHNIALDFSKSLTRPFFDFLNPYKVWNSELSYNKGNMYLRPMITTSLGLTYTLLRDYVIGALYEYDADAYSSYSLPLSNNVIENGICNYGHDNNFTLYCSVNKSFFKGLWRVTASADFNYTDSKGMVESVDVGFSECMWSAQLRNVITLSKKWGIIGRVNYSYFSPVRGLTRISYDKHLLSLSLAKTFENGSLLNIYLSNILNYKANGYFDNSQYYYRQRNQLNQILLQVQYTYTFGNKKLRQLKDRSSDNNLNRFKR